MRIPRAKRTREFYSRLKKSNGEGVIVCGHTRYKAAGKLGLEKVPVHVAKDQIGQPPA